METPNPRQIRGRILTILYENFLEDPHKMLTPDEIVGEGSVTREALAPGAYYLHDRELIELLIGYNPPLFAAARISPKGIDLVEDLDRFRTFFALDDRTQNADAARVAALVMTLADEAAASPIEGIRRDWLVRDITQLRDELRRSKSEWRSDVIADTLQWIRAYFNGACDAHLASMAELERLLGFGRQPGGD